MAFPTQRLRRLRRTRALRLLTQETRLSPSDFILPLFVVEGLKKPESIVSMPGVERHSLDSLVREAGQAHALGVPAVLLFGVPKKKDAAATEAYRSEGIVQKAVRRLKKEIPSLVVITDVCACEYTSHGHCGIIQKGEVANDPTLGLLRKIALSHAQAGADIVAPSDMMDGRVGAIRAGLDAQGYNQTPILSYAAKFASAFYGPFRDAAESAPAFGDRRSYQMNGANAREALREIAADIEEGADLIMVKPALSALDLIAKARRKFDLPLWAYQVSGEYSMIKAAARMKWLDEEAAMMESLLAIRRAGADRVLTYWAKEAARVLRREKS
ncbi:MAG TPA: porphobilinogen synthase [bacterium]|nr:porphobilinogen synthase [bacterium]